MIREYNSPVMLETIGLSKQIDENEISSFLQEIFPGLQFQKIDLDSIPLLNSNKTNYFLNTSESEFPIWIEILINQEQNTDEREQYIARKLSTLLECKTIVGYQEKGSSNPYYAIIFDNGKAFLASDFETKFANDGENEVQIIKELEDLSTHSFDEFGEILI